jgi:Cu-Zn family superoxide dismutase
MKSVWILTFGCVLLAACSGGNSIFSKKQSATAVLAPTKGNSVSGTVNFTQKGEAVLVEAKITGLAANGTHGFHIHEKGNCSAADASSAGAHFNPSGAKHGGQVGAVRHGGDLANSIIGRAVIVHGGPDDLKSQPAGNSGPRVACGLISKNPDKVF